jgi:hypothetical protein
MHCHSTASHFSKLGVQRSPGQLSAGYRRALDVAAAAPPQALARAA